MRARKLGEEGSYAMKQARIIELRSLVKIFTIERATFAEKGTVKILTIEGSYVLKKRYL